MVTLVSFSDSESPNALRPQLCFVPGGECRVPGIKVGVAVKTSHRSCIPQIPLWPCYNAVLNKATHMIFKIGKRSRITQLF